MRRYFLFIVFSALLTAGYSIAQDIPAHKIPSEVMAEFQQQYPEAKDVDWELKEGNFEVDFELGWRGFDHEILYDSTGSILRHKAEISKKELPEDVSSMLDNDFKWYWIRDVKKIVEGNDTIYLMEARSFFKEWELTVKSDGSLLT